MTFRNLKQSSGIIVSERIHEEINVMVTTLKIGAVYSPAVDSARKIGKKAAAVVSDDVRSGILSSAAESMAASSRPLPSASCVMMDSVITMELSTSIPSEMISAARDI